MGGRIKDLVHIMAETGRGNVCRAECRMQVGLETEVLVDAVVLCLKSLGEANRLETQKLRPSFCLMDFEVEFLLWEASVVCLWPSLIRRGPSTFWRASPLYLQSTDCKT